MGGSEEAKIIGQAVLALRSKKHELAVLESKAKFMAQDCEFVADLLSTSREPDYTQTFPSHEERGNMWAGKIEGRLDMDDTKWPTWEEVTNVFRSIQQLRGSVVQLTKQIEQIGLN